MKALALFSNVQEGLSLRKTLGIFEWLEFPRTVAETSEALIHNPDCDFLVLDEGAGDILGILEELAVLRRAKAPSVLILVSPREAGEAAFEQECERLETYANLGAEFFLYRPFTTEEFQAKVSLVRAWIQSPPAWVQLMRVSRSFIRAREADRVLAAWEDKLQQAPDDLPVGLRLARGYLSCVPAVTNRALALLTHFRDQRADDPSLATFLCETQLAANRLDDAFRTAFTLLTDFPSKARADYLIDIYERLARDGRPAAFWLAHLDELTGCTGAPFEPLRHQAFKRLLQRVETPAHVEVVVEHLERYRFHAPSVVPNLRRFDIVLGTRSGRAPRELRARLLASILEGDPSSSSLLRDYMSLQRELGNLHAVEACLRKLRLAGNLGFEYQVAMAELQSLSLGAEKAAPFVEAARAQALSEEQRAYLEKVLRIVAVPSAQLARTGTDN